MKRLYMDRKKVEVLSFEQKEAFYQKVLEKETEETYVRYWHILLCVSVLLSWRFQKSRRNTGTADYQLPKL